MRKVLRLFVFIFILAFLASYFLSMIEVKYKDVIDEAAEEYDLERPLVYALVMTESKYDASAESAKGAMGLMQITPDTALWCTEKMENPDLAADILVPEVNVKIGCFYLKYLLDKYGEDNVLLK